LTHNCGLTQIDLSGNKVSDDLLKYIKEELEMNAGIVDVIFPVIQQRELQMINQKMKLMRKDTMRSKRLN